MACHQNPTLQVPRILHESLIRGCRAGSAERSVDFNDERSKKDSGRGSRLFTMKALEVRSDDSLTFDISRDSARFLEQISQWRDA